jgi:hypothetical protein
MHRRLNVAVGPSVFCLTDKGVQELRNAQVALTNLGHRLRQGLVSEGWPALGRPTSRAPGCECTPWARREKSGAEAARLRSNSGYTGSHFAD